MFTEDDLLPLSGLQHLAFCERQWALIHLEQAWSENRLTAEGRVLHDRVHESAADSRVDVVIARGLPLQCLRVGISGQANAVEFHRAFPGHGPAPGTPPNGNAATPLPGRAGFWRPLPVEYKHGRAKRGDCDRVQLCAQALCLEEMFGVEIPAGSLFYATPRRRTLVEFTPALRARTEALCARMHSLFRHGLTPAPVYTKACESCSLMEHCLPKALAPHPDVASYLASAFQEA